MRGLVVTLLLLLAFSSGNAVAQNVGGLKVKYDLPFRSRPDIEKAILEQQPVQVREQIRKVHVFTAGASGDITEVMIIQTQYSPSAPYDLDSATQGALNNVRRFEGVTEAKDAVTPTLVSGREGRIVSFEARSRNGRFALESMLVHDRKTNTAWVIQISVGRLHSTGFEKARERARLILASATVAQ